VNDTDDSNADYDFIDEEIPLIECKNSKLDLWNREKRMYCPDFKD